MWSIWLWVFPLGEVQLYLWMAWCGNIVLFGTRFFDVAKFKVCLQHTILCLVKEGLWDTCWYCHIILAYVTTKILLQRADKMKNTSCQDPTQPYRWQPSCSSIDGSISNVHRTARLHIKWHPSFQLSGEASWMSQMLIWCRSARSHLKVVLFTE